MPDVTLNLDGVLTDRERLAAYDRVCGFDLSNVLPPTYPHILAFPLHLALLTDGRLPVLPRSAWSTSSIGSSSTGRSRPASRSTSGSGPPRWSHTHGAASSRCAPRSGWAGTVSGRRCPPTCTAAAPIGRRPRPTAPPSSEALPASATWRLRGDLGRRYGAVSGDLNPIHVHPLSARLFGFHSAIAHGMWTKARSLAALGPQLPGAFAVEVAFRRPLLLPATVTVRRSPGAGARSASGCATPSAARSHLDGLADAPELKPLRARAANSSNMRATRSQSTAVAAQRAPSAVNSLSAWRSSSPS